MDQTSLQPFGEATIEVVYYVEPIEAASRDCPASGGVTIIGAKIAGAMVDVVCFAAHIVEQWQQAIENEHEREVQNDYTDWRISQPEYSDRHVGFGVLA